ncbi:BTB/POZ domain-containing protein 6-A, partial [Stegodyphus mimosarum]
METETVTFQNHSETLETLTAALTYQIQAMQTICVNNLITILETSNVCEIYDYASSYHLNELEFHCLKLIDKHAEDVLKSRGFMTLPKATVLNIIKRNSLNINSEISVFQAVLGWGFNDCHRRSLSSDDTQRFIHDHKTLFENVRFLNMSKEELKDPEVEKHYKLICAEEHLSKRKSLLESETKPRSTTLDSAGAIPRQYATHYFYELDIYETDQQPVKNGEVFCISIEILKGKVFLTSVTLALETFAATKNTACLYVVSTATNVLTNEQKTARGTFMNTSEVALLEFSSPLMAKESERIDIALKVKRAENICPMMIKNDIQIAMSESKEVAMKVIPSIASGDNKEGERCIFKEIVYFY